MSNLLEIKDLHVNAGEKEILKGIDLDIKKGEIHVIMGPNGSGKTTTANAILNNPEYTKTNGTIELTEEGENLAKKILEAYDIVYVFLKEVLNLDDEAAQSEAEKIKSSISDDTINKLAKYVHKVLGLSNLNCNYDINQEKCRNCIKRINTK